MASIYKETEETRTYTSRELIRTECDRCGAVIPPDEPYEDRELDLRFTIGSSYPEGGNKDGWQVEDLCDECVTGLHKLLQEWGCTISDYQIDW